MQKKSSWHAAEWREKKTKRKSEMWIRRKELCRAISQWEKRHMFAGRDGGRAEREGRWDM